MIVAPLTGFSSKSRTEIMRFPPTPMGKTVTIASPSLPAYPDFKAVALMVQTVWISTVGVVNIAVYIPFLSSVMSEKFPPRSDVSSTVAPGMGAGGVSVPSVTLTVMVTCSAEVVILGFAATETVNCGSIKY